VRFTSPGDESCHDRPIGLDELDGEPIRVLLSASVFAAKVAQMVVKLVQDREWVVQIFAFCRQYLLPVRRVDRLYTLRPPLDHPNAELGPLDPVVLAEKVQRPFGVGIEDRRDDEGPELLFGRVLDGRRRSSAVRLHPR
jgi:hypothetical protein